MWTRKGTRLFRACWPRAWWSCGTNTATTWATTLTRTGRGLHVWRDDLTGKTLRAVCEVAFYPMEDGDDEPQIPEYAHAALADYICYRHLSSGNLAKQSRAQFYQNSFYQTMQRIRPQGMGSVTRFEHLYEVTDARYRR